MKTILKKFAAFLCAALVLCACSDDDYSEAHQTLMALIRQAESLVEESTEGIEEGDTAPGSKKALQARIDQAYYIMHNTSRDEGYRNACKQLEEAIKAFRENIVKAGIPYFNAGSKMNLGPAGDWDLTEELTWEMKIRFDEFAAGDQNVISCEQGKGAIMIRNNGANLQFYVNDGSWKGGTCCTIELNKWYHITATYKANDKMHFYLDGRLVKTSRAARPSWSRPATCSWAPPLLLEPLHARQHPARFDLGGRPHRGRGRSRCGMRLLRD